jgi:predicted  nucleic acid-binding Zn-ribbon protein
MKVRVVAVAVLLGLAGWTMARVAAQSQTRDATLADVVTEIKLLRDAVENTNRTQALTSMVALQQARTQSIADELATLRRDLLAATDVFRQTERALTELQSPIQPREEILRASLQQTDARIATLRRQEAELTQRLQSENATAAKLAAQLQASVRR